MGHFFLDTPYFNRLQLRYDRFVGVTVQNGPLVTIYGAIGSIRDSIKSTKKKLKLIRLPELETVQWILHIKSVNNPFKQLKSLSSKGNEFLFLISERDKRDTILIDVLPSA